MALLLQLCGLKHTSSFLGLVPCLTWRYLMALKSPTSYGLQNNPGFIYTASFNELSGYLPLSEPLGLDSATTCCLASLSSPVKPSPYLSWFWSHHHMENTEKSGCQLGINHDPLNPHWQQLLIEVAFQKPKKTPHTLFTNWKLSWMRSCPEGTFPLLDCRSDLSLVALIP